MKHFLRIAYNTIINKKMGRTVTILGSTGLIGSHLLRILINDPNTEKIIALVRKTADLHNPKLEQYVIDFTDPKAYEQYIAGSSVVFSAVGTTRSEVEGDEEEYRKVLKNLIIRKHNEIKSEESENIWEKIINFAYGKGYESELILSILKELKI
jgi:UDP-glucose 6-dehydrogenase